MGGINFNPLFFRNFGNTAFHPTDKMALISGFINAQKSLYKRDARGKIVFKHICLLYLENLPK